MQNQTVRFTDARSRKQAADYFAHRLHGADERNAANMERWNDHLRQEWELRNIGTARVRGESA